MSKKFLTIERQVTTTAFSTKQTLYIPKGTMVELLCVNATHRGAMFRIKTNAGEVTELEPRVFDQNQVQPLLREAYSRR